MTTASVTETDIRLRDTVVRQLDWNPQVNASAIGVTAAESVVTLTGFVVQPREPLEVEPVDEIC